MNANSKSHTENAAYIVNFNPQQFYPAKPVYVGFASYDQARDLCYRLKLLRNGESSQVNIEIPYLGWEENAATESYARYILSLPTVGDFDGFGSFHTQESHAQEQLDFAPYFVQWIDMNGRIQTLQNLPSHILERLAFLHNNEANCKKYHPTYSGLTRLNEEQERKAILARLQPGDLCCNDQRAYLQLILNTPGDQKVVSLAEFCFELHNPKQPEPTELDLRNEQARLANAQYLTTCSWSGDITLHNLPLPIPGHVSLRECKRAMRQIEKLMAKGDGSMDWYEGWANQDNSSPSLGLLAFGSRLDDAHNKHCPQNKRYGFSSWLWKVAEALGYECTDQDQTSRCDDCNLAIDTGSSTPDYYTIIQDSSIVCGKCANNQLADSINHSQHGRLTFKPHADKTDNYLTSIYGNLIKLTFDYDSTAERFAKDHLLSPSETWSWVKGWHTSADLYFKHDNLRNESLANYGKPDEWAVYRARINWPEYRDNYDFFAMREFWSFVENRVEESKYPLLSFLAQGKIEEGLLFHCEIELLEQILIEYNETCHKDLRLSNLAHTELQYSEIEEGN